MHARSKSSTPIYPWKNVSLDAQNQPDPAQLDNIKTQLDLVLLALEALTGIGSEAMLQAATELNLETTLADRVTLWRLRQANPLRKGTSGRKRLDVEEARSLVLISCHLAKQHHELIRRAVALLEQLTEEKRQLHQVALIGDYLDAFINIYEERMAASSASVTSLTFLALKLLVELLFYSSERGPRHLWLALLERTNEPATSESF